MFVQIQDLFYMGLQYKQKTMGVLNTYMCLLILVLPVYVLTYRTCPPLQRLTRCLPFLIPMYTKYLIELPIQPNGVGLTNVLNVLAYVHNSEHQVSIVTNRYTTRHQSQPVKTNLPLCR